MFSKSYDRFYENIATKTEKLYVKKVWTTFWIISSVLIVVLLVYGFISAWLGRLGELEYLIAVFDSQLKVQIGDYAGFTGITYNNPLTFHSFHFITLAQYLMEYILLSISHLFFVGACMQLTGSLVKNRYVVLFLTSGLFILGYLMSQAMITKEGIEWVPFLYSNYRMC